MIPSLLAPIPMHRQSLISRACRAYRDPRVWGVETTGAARRLATPGITALFFATAPGGGATPGIATLFFATLMAVVFIALCQKQTEIHRSYSNKHT